jgi:hypothetical protein
MRAWWATATGGQDLERAYSLDAAAEETLAPSTAIIRVRPATSWPR